MRHVSVLALSLALLTWLVAAAGCMNGDRGGEMDPSPQPFVRTLADPCDYHLLLTGRPQTWGMRAGRVQLAPGQSIGVHSTKGNEELLVFFSGEGIALLGENTQLHVGAGRIAYIPPQTAHNIENTGTKPLVYIFCVAPAAGGRD